MGERTTSSNEPRMLVDDREVAMVRSALTTQEKAEIWRRYREGDSLRSTSRALGRSMQALRRLVASTGGRAPVVPRRSKL
jgi:hypothetical protein